LAVRALYGHYAGYTKVGGCHLYVNRGLGTSGPPSRVAVRPEITKIVLVSS
jgi:predicted MPP superfamily phosphohydrolase